MTTRYDNTMKRYLVERFSKNRTGRTSAPTSMSCSTIRTRSRCHGDGDMFRPEHEIKFYQALGGGKQDFGWARETVSQDRLAILADLTHYDIVTSPRLYATLLPFLNDQRDAKSWVEQVQNAK